MVGFGQTKAAEQFPGRHFGQILFAMILAAVGVDGCHGQAGLDTTCRAESGVHTLQLAHDQAIGDIPYARTPVALQRRPQKPEIAHFAHDDFVE